MSNPNKREDTSGKKVIEMSKFIATMCCNTSRIQKTGVPLTNDEFMDIYNNLPDTVVIEFEDDNDNATKREVSQQAVSALVGNSAVFRSKAREEQYDEMCVLMSLDTAGKVTAFNKSDFMSVAGTPVSVEKFVAPESADPNNEVYEHIKRTLGTFAVYSERRAVSVNNAPKASKTSKFKTGHTKYFDEQQGNRAISLESMVPIECKSLFSPSKVNPFTFISSKSRPELDDFLDDMRDQYNYGTAEVLVTLLGLYNQVKESDAQTVLQLLGDEVEAIGPAQIEAYQASITAALCSMFSDNLTKPAPLDMQGGLDVLRTINLLMDHNASFKQLIDTGRDQLRLDNYMKVLVDSQPDQANLAIVSNYIPIVLSDETSLTPRESLDFIWSLMELIGGLTSNSVVSVTVKDCDVVTFGK